MEYIDNIVLGAGIAGLAYANAKAGSNQNTVVFEKNEYYGGLCHSFTVGEFTFDSAVHLSFTDNPEARKLFDMTDVYKHNPLAYNFYYGNWIKHPVLNNLNFMEADERVKCLQSFIERDTDIEIRNYEDWLYASYGREIAERFYALYTKKYWTVEPKKLSTSWVGTRLNKPDLNKVLLGAVTSSTGQDYYAKEMRYPKSMSGGYQQFLEPLLNGVDIRYGMEAVRIDTDEQIITFIDGSKYHYNRLVSSAPLPDIVKMIKDVPKDILEHSSNLKASSIGIVSVGFNRPDVSKHLWCYIYDDDIMASRMNSPSIKSVKNAPVGCSSIQFEIYGVDNISKEEAIDNTKYAIRKMGLCDEKDIMFMDYRILPYGNVLFLNDMEKHRKAVKEYLKDKIVLIGRFGEWDYFWSDQSYLSGRNAAKCN